MHQFYSLSAFAEQMLIHEHALVKIREDMPFDRAALIGCGVTTGFGAVINTAKVEVGSTVAVIGCGGIGLSAINGAAIAGAGRIIAVDIKGSKLNLAKHFGATDVVNAAEVDPVEAVREMTGGGVEYSFEALGLKATSRAGLPHAAPLRHGDHHRHGARGPDDRSSRRRPARRQGAAGLQHGLEPLPRRHAALRRLLPQRQAASSTT